MAISRKKNSVVSAVSKKALVPLVPMPRKIAWGSDRLPLARRVFVMLQDHPAARDVFAAERFVLEAEPLTGMAFSIGAGDGAHAAEEVRVRHDDSVGEEAAKEVRDQAYRLTISHHGIEIAARTAAGSFYGFQTLLQIIRAVTLAAKGASAKNEKKTASHVSLPCCTIEDWPDFSRRGVYHDTARGKVPTLETLLQLVDDLGHLKYNEFQLYVENAFEFRRNPAMYDDTTPLTAEELLVLDAACRARHIDFVPSLTSLGHFEKILNRPGFRHLAESEPEQLKAIGATCWFESGPWSLCATDPAARAFLKDMYDEFVPNFSSRRFNICCDEAYDLGTVRSKAYADKLGEIDGKPGSGVGRLYVEWINYCNDLAKHHGKSIQMWGDIILKYPDLIEQLPGDATLLEWGYEHDHKFMENSALFSERIRGEAKDGRQTFYVCPGTSSWLTLASRSKTAFGNIHSAATAGLKFGATGVLVTDWGDNGHQQMLAVSLLPFAYGAAASWNLAASENPYETPLDARKSEFLQGVSLHLFQQCGARDGGIAALAYKLGLTYLRFSWQRFNAGLEWYLFREKWDFANYVNRAEAVDLPKVIKACESLRKQFEACDVVHENGGQLVAEFVFTCDEIIHACRRTALRKAWLAADPLKRNPEEPTKRDLKAKPLPRDFRKQVGGLAKEIRRLKEELATLWLARNKPSRLADVTAEFDRLEAEYRSVRP